MNLTIDVGAPIRRDALTLFPLFGVGPAAPDYIPGPVAWADGLVTVDEQGDGAQVAQLVMHNRGAQPVLLIEGEMVVGAKQHRTLNVSVLCEQGASTTIPVSCVEQGRWGTPRTSSRSARHAPPGLRRDKVASTQAAARHGFRSDQGRVWAQVRDYELAFASGSPTHALEDVFEDTRTRVAGTIAGFEPEPGQHGVLLAIGDRIRGLDLFDRPATLTAYWDGLISGYALDALATPSVTGQVSKTDARGFVTRVLGADISSAPSPGLGRQCALTGPGVHGAALDWEGSVVHLAAFASEPGPRVTPRHDGAISRRRWFTR